MCVVTLGLNDATMKIESRDIIRFIAQCLSLQHSRQPERLVLLNSGTCSRNLEEADCSPSAHFKFGDQKKSAAQLRARAI